MQNGRPGRRTVALELRVELAGHANKHSRPTMPAAYRLLHAAREGDFYQYQMTSHPPP